MERIAALGDMSTTRCMPSSAASAITPRLSPPHPPDRERPGARQAARLALHDTIECAMCSPNCPRRNHSPRSKPCCRPVSTPPPWRQTPSRSPSSPHVNRAVSGALAHIRRAAGFACLRAEARFRRGQPSGLEIRRPRIRKTGSVGRHRSVAASREAADGAVRGAAPRYRPGTGTAAARGVSRARGASSPGTDRASSLPG